MRLFISYSSEDQVDLAIKLEQALKEEKHAVFLDRGKDERGNPSLEPGDPYHQKLRESIEHSEAMIYLMSRASLSGYAREELSIAQSVWGRATNRVLPFMTEDLATHEIPAFLSAVHIERVTSEAVPSILGAVRRLARRRRRRTLTRIIVSTLALIAATLASWSFAKRTPSAINPWLQAQGQPTWVLLPKPHVIAGMNLLTGIDLHNGRISDVPGLVRQIYSTDPRAWRFLSELHPEGAGTIFFQMRDERDFIVGVPLKTSVADLHKVLVSAGINIATETTVAGVKVFKIQAPNPNIGVTLVNNDVAPYNRLLLFGAFDLIEDALLRRAEHRESKVPRDLESVTEFRDFWALWMPMGQASTARAPLDAGKADTTVEVQKVGWSKEERERFALDEWQDESTDAATSKDEAALAPLLGDAGTVAEPQRIVVGIHGFSNLMELGEKSDFRASVRVDWQTKDEAVAGAQFIGLLRRRAGEVFSDECTLKAAYPMIGMFPFPLTDGLALFEMFLETMAVRLEAKAAYVDFDVRRLNGPTMAQRVARRLHSQKECNLPEEPLVSAHEGMSARARVVLAGGLGPEGFDELLQDIAHVRRPTEVLVPLVRDMGTEPDEAGRIGILLMASMSRTEQAVDWLENGMPPLNPWSFRTSIDEYNVKPTELVWGTMLMSTLRPGFMPAILRTYSRSQRRAPKTLVPLLRVWLCRPPMPGSEDYRSVEPWISMGVILNEKGVPYSELAETAIGGMASCALNPDGDGLLRLAEAWPELPHWVQTVLPSAIIAQLQEEPSGDWPYRVGGLSPGPAKSALLPTTELPRAKERAGRGRWPAVTGPSIKLWK